MEPELILRVQNKEPEAGSGLELEVEADKLDKHRKMRDGRDCSLSGTVGLEC